MLLVLVVLLRRALTIACNQERLRLGPRVMKRNLRKGQNLDLKGRIAIRGTE